MEYTHDDLVKIAEKWLLNSKRCGFALTELATDAGETPDSIGFRGGVSILVEAKASRSDFLSDKTKLFRRNPWAGMGAFRFYLCPKGIINPEDLPEKWGLLWVDDKGKVRQRVGPKGNIWSSRNMESFFFSEKNERGEKAMMYSALRRLHLQGCLPKIYGHFKDGIIQPQNTK